ncbi:MAG: homoprotocatechuate degradation operon regulator HpaR [Pararhodobacter sp.]|nr:homoprotocatechuate degradation operon regulator HpaR [Pararhodobacter sp.]
MTHSGLPEQNSLPRTARSLPIALLRARETVMAPIRDMLAESGVNEQKWRVLRVLEEAGPMDQSLLAREACLQLPSLTRILRTMDEQGLIARAVDPADRRRSIVSISDEGRAVIARHAAASRALFAQLEASYGSKRLEHLLDLLAALDTIDLPAAPRR